MNAKRLCKACIIIASNKLSDLYLMSVNETPNILAGIIVDGSKCINPKKNELIIIA